MWTCPSLLLDVTICIYFHRFTRTERVIYHAEAVDENTFDISRETKGPYQIELHRKANEHFATMFFSLFKMTHLFFGSCTE